MHILIIEDELKLAAAVAQGLGDHGYGVTFAHNAGEAEAHLHRQDIDLVLLDVMLPGQSGLEILRSMREQGRKTPVLMLTSKDSINDRVDGLDAGADDYLVKPFAFPELLARVRALLRRNEPRVASTLQIADLDLDLAGRTAVRSGIALDLTAREFDLMEYLALNRGNVVSREMLAKEVWKETARFTPIDNVIDVQIARPRRKLDDPFVTKLLHTVRGVGFVLRRE